MWAVEEGNVEEVRKLLSEEIHGDLAADINTKGLD